MDQALATIEAALSNVQLVSEPFPHFAIPDLFDAEIAKAVLIWLEQDAQWAVESRKFYVHHGCTSIAERVSGTPAEIIGAPETLQCMRRHLERIFGVTLSNSHFELAAHRMLPGHRIGIHTDTPGYGTETHRLLINLNSGFEDEHGGHLVLLDLHDPEASAVIVRPVHNSAVAMEFSDHSWHCVDEIMSGKRYSLVYSFWLENSVSDKFDSKTDVERDDKLWGVTEEELREMMALLREAGAGTVPHSSRFLMDHLSGTYHLLKKWQCDSDVCKAGLFHSVFGTPSFPHHLLADDYVASVRELIGERSLMLVRLFSRMDVPLLLSIVSGDSLSDSGGAVALTPKDKRALVCLVWANVCEQSHYVPNSGEMVSELKSLYRDTAHLLPPQSGEEIRSMLSL